MRKLIRLGEFDSMAARYLDNADRFLAKSSLHERHLALRPGSPIIKAFGALDLDAIDLEALKDFWEREVTNTGRRHETGMAMLNAVSAVFNYAREVSAYEGVNHFTTMRRIASKARRTKKGAAEAPGSIHVISAADIKLLFKQRALEPDGPHMGWLCCLLAGLRVSETWALRWSDVSDGKISIKRSRPRGSDEDEATKSGRERKVIGGAVMLEAFAGSGSRVPSQARVMEGISTQQFCLTWYPAFIKRAGCTRHTLKTLRATFASRLVSGGVNLPYIAKQLGHVSILTTERHYAVYQDEFSGSFVPREGQVAADLVVSM